MGRKKEVYLITDSKLVCKTKECALKHLNRAYMTTLIQLTEQHPNLKRLDSDEIDILTKEDPMILGVVKKESVSSVYAIVEKEIPNSENEEWGLNIDPYLVRLKSGDYIFPINNGQNIMFMINKIVKRELLS